MRIKLVVGNRYFAKDNGSTFGEYDKSVEESGKREVRLLKIDERGELIVTPVDGDCAGTEYVCSVFELREIR